MGARWTARSAVLARTSARDGETNLRRDDAVLRLALSADLSRCGRAARADAVSRGAVCLAGGDGRTLSLGDADDRADAGRAPARNRFSGRAHQYLARA